MYPIDVKNGLANDLDQNTGPVNPGEELLVIGQFYLVDETEKCLYFRGKNKSQFSKPMSLPKSQTIRAELDEKTDLFALSIPRWLAGRKVSEGFLEIIPHE